MPIWYTGTRNLPLPLINHKNASLQKEIGSSYIFVAVFFTRNFVVNEKEGMAIKFAIYLFAAVVWISVGVFW